MKIRIGKKSYVTTSRFKNVMITATATLGIITASTIILINATSQTVAAKQIPITEVKSLEVQPLFKQEIIVPKIQRLSVEVKAEVKEEPKPKFAPLQEGNLRNYDLRKLSNLTAEQVNLALEDTGLEGLGKAFVEAEKKFNINALYFISHAALESSWGKSEISKNKNNLFGFAAYDVNPSKYSKSFSSKSECILYVAEYVATHYISEDGQYYNGPTLKGMNVRYAKDKDWSDKIADVMMSVQYKIMQANVL